MSSGVTRQPGAGAGLPRFLAERGRSGVRQCAMFALTVVVAAGVARAEVRVAASVDRARLALGESAALTVTIQGVQNAAPPPLPAIEGLQFAGPSSQTSLSFVNNQMTASASFTWRITPVRTGEFVIPSLGMEINGQRYQTDPIKMTVTEAAPAPDLARQLFARVRVPSRVYLGQTAPLEVIVYARADLPLKGLAGFHCNAEDLGYKFLPNLKSGTQVINGEQFQVLLIEGAISPTRSGVLPFGPCVLQAQLAAASPRRNEPFGGSLFDQFFGNIEVRQVPVTVDPVSVEVLSLPAEGRPPDFAGAVGQWQLAVTAKPTELAVGDPITLTIKVSGRGNIDTVPPPQLNGLDLFKTYDPTVKTDRNELNTEGERVFQQVLVPADTTATNLPEVRLSYFDPQAGTYQTAVQPPIHLVVGPGTGSPGAIISGGPVLRPRETLGQDIVYLKGDLGPAPGTSLCARPVFWVLNSVPILGLAGGLLWQRRQDKLRGDVAFARRSRAARQARKRLATAADYDQLQRVLQQYLGDRLNLPGPGITASIVDEHLLPRGASAEVAATVRSCFEACDAARFAGVADADHAALKAAIDHLIDELEQTQL